MCSYEHFHLLCSEALRINTLNVYKIFSFGLCRSCSAYTFLFLFRSNNLFMFRLLSSLLRPVRVLCCLLNSLCVYVLFFYMCPCPACILWFIYVFHNFFHQIMMILNHLMYSQILLVGLLLFRMFL